MWVLKLNEVAQGYFEDRKDAELHATKMFGKGSVIPFQMVSSIMYTTTIPDRGNVTVTIEFEED